MVQLNLQSVRNLVFQVVSQKSLNRRDKEESPSNNNSDLNEKVLIKKYRWENTSSMLRSGNITGSINTDRENLSKWGSLIIQP